MPLTSIAGDQAFVNLRANRKSLWPDGRRDHVRLSGVAQVGFEPGFQLVRGEAVFTVGSCFARNIEKRLAEIGFEIPSRALRLPEEERASETENDFLNKYPPQSILNEFRWALDPDYSFPEDGLIELKNDQWHDPHSAPNVKPAPLERVLERREMVAALYRQIPACRVVVMTLGLVEAWFDEKAGYYLNGAPPLAALQAEPGRFRLDVLTPDEIHQTLVEIHNLLSRFGHPDFRMLLTVSPVPFKNTFTGKDAITANTYSKSALRAAAEMFVHGHERVDYFPSYEVVTHTVRSSAYIQDNRHVTPQIVDVIVDRVVQAYCPDAATPEEWERVSLSRSSAEIYHAAKSGDFARALQLYADLETDQLYLQAGYTEHRFRYDFGRLLLRTGAFAEAQAHLARAIAAGPHASHAHFQHARALTRLQRPIEAEASFRKAIKLNPDNAEFRLGLALQLCQNGDFDGAEQEIEVVLDRDPASTRARETLTVVQTRRDARRAAEAKAQRIASEQSAASLAGD